MNELLVQAITQRRRLALVYDGKPRRAEPQCYGRGKSGNDLLRVVLLDGPPPAERLLVVDRIGQLTLSDEHFERPGPNYRRDDGAMQAIYCQL